MLLGDQFGATNMTVVNPKRFCNPADKNDEGIVDPTAHLACYKISRPRGGAQFEKREVVVENQFGQLTLLIVRPGSLCVPAEKDGVPSALSTNHFQCYKARVSPRTPKFEKAQVNVPDQFETKETVVIKPKVLCNPVDKNGQGVINPAGHLVCCRIKDASGQPKFSRREVDILDQFAEQSVGARQGDCRKSTVLCVPSTKRLLSPSGAFLDPTTGVLD